VSGARPSAERAVWRASRVTGDVERLGDVEGEEMLLMVPVVALNPPAGFASVFDSGERRGHESPVREAFVDLHLQRVVPTVAERRPIYRDSPVTCGNGGSA